MGILSAETRKLGRVDFNIDVDKYRRTKEKNYPAAAIDFGI